MCGQNNQVANQGQTPTKTSDYYADKFAQQSGQDPDEAGYPFQTPDNSDAEVTIERSESGNYHVSIREVSGVFILLSTNNEEFAKNFVKGYLGQYTEVTVK